MDETKAAAGEAEAGYRIMDEWLRLDAEHTEPGFLVPSQDRVVAWCEAHAGTIVLSANALLWAPVIWAMCKG